MEKGLSKINESIRKIEFLFQNIVGEDIPLKQGLKLTNVTSGIDSGHVGEDIPLKQGLKLISSGFILFPYGMSVRTFH